jgi:5'-3' exoribonuclease 2
MTDPESLISDFYPENFVTDTKGKRFAWLGEVLLPFIEENRLLRELIKLEHQLTRDE